MLAAIYLTVLVIWAVVVTLGFRRFINSESGDVSDELGDWIFYIVEGILCGLVWPLSLPVFTLAWVASRIAKKSKKRSLNR